MARKFSRREVDDWAGRWATLRERLWALPESLDTYWTLILMEAQTLVGTENNLEIDPSESDEPAAHLPAKVDVVQLLTDLQTKTLVVCREAREALPPCLTWLHEVHQTGPVEHRGCYANSWSELILDMIENSKSFDSECVYRGLDLELVPAAMNELEAMGRQIVRSDKASSEGNGVSKDEANVRLRKLLLKNPKMSSRDAGSKIGRSASSVVNMPAWRAVQDKLKMQKPPAPRGVQASDELLDRLSAESYKDKQDSESSFRGRRPSV